MIPKRRFCPLFAWAVLLGSGILAAQDSLKLTLETMNDPELFKAFTVPRVWWNQDNTAMIFDNSRPPAERILERMDPSTGQRTPVLDPKQAEEKFKALFPEGKAPLFNPIPAAFTRNGRYGLYIGAGDLFVLDLQNTVFFRITETPEEERCARFSPDGTQLAFVRNNDLYVHDIAKNKEVRLTRDGSSTLLNGTLSWVYWEEVFGRQDIGYWWSEDSKAIAYLQTDESGVSVQHYVNIEPWTPTVREQRYPKVGEMNPEVKLGIIEVDSKKTRWAGLDRGSYEYIIRVAWLPDSRRVAVRTMNRLQTELDLVLVDRRTGSSRFILKETDPGWVNISEDLYFLKDGEHFIMASARSGYEHLYLFDMDGRLVRPLTEGEWSLCTAGGGMYWVRKAVTGIDEDNGWVYFTALEKSSIEKHLYRVRIDGTGIQRLTQEDGTHAIFMSPDARYYVDRHSTISTPPCLTLYEAPGSKKLILGQGDASGMEKYGFQFSEIVRIPARDGFLLPASITRPRDFDPGRKYPVIVSVYGGPSAPQVADAFSRGCIWENVLLNEGYVCMTVDNRAATAISKKLENLLARNSPGSVELNDLVDAVQWVKKQPGIDPDRFGITGWSGGGTNTILAMTRSTEFKAGIAGAGVTDYRFYDSVWAEAIMKTEKENLEGYTACSLLQYAKDLHGRLMIVHGLHDDNVHIQNTWRFVDELIKAGKLFDLMVYPMRGHGVGDPAGRAHLNRVMLDFWKRNLY